MKRIAALSLGAALVAAACGGGGAAASETYVTNLSPANEVPPITNAESSASGTCTFTLDLTRDGSGKITAATGKVEIVVRGFTATSAITGAHIHNGAAGTIAGVVIPFAGPGEMTLASGGATFNKSAIAVKEDIATALVANPAGHYCNVHSTLNAGGAVRGQLAKKT